MRRNEMYMGMTIIFKLLQEKAFNFQDYRSEGIDSLKSAAELGQPLRNYSRAVTTWELLLYESLVIQPRIMLLLQERLKDLKPAVNRQPGYRRGDS